MKGMKLTADPQFGGLLLKLRIGKQDIILTAGEMYELFALLAVSLVGRNEVEDHMHRSVWTQECVVFGAELSRALQLAEITRESALVKIQSLWPGLSPADAAVIFKKINEELCRERRA